MIFSAGQLKVGDLVGVRDGNLVKYVPVEAVKQSQVWVATKPQVKLGKKYTQKVPLRMSSFAAWLQAGRPYVDKIRQNRAVIQNTYPLFKTSYKVQGKWCTVPALTPVCVHDD